MGERGASAPWSCNPSAPGPGGCRPPFAMNPFFGVRLMPDLPPPHGGLSEPVSRMVPPQEVNDFRGKAASLKKVPVSDADLSSPYRLGDGGLSPLTGPMDRGAYDRVLDEEIIVRDGKKYAWAIPISFPVSAELAGTLKTGETVALVNSKDEAVGTLTIND